MKNEHLAKTLKKCEFCGEIFDRPFRSGSNFKISWGNYYERRFCSLKCKGAWSSLNLVKENNPNYRGGKSKCIDCGKELSQRYSFRNTNRCKECWNKHISIPENHPNWKGGIKNKCIDCGKEIYHGQKRCFECYHKTHTGKNSPVYKEKPTNYAHLHIVVKREKGEPTKCEHCGKPTFKRSNGSCGIELANKTGKYLRDVSDWIYLCHRCHRIYDIKNNLFNLF
jgi:hypothetical protein